MYSAGGVSTVVATLENDLVISKKLKRNKPIDPEISLLAIYPKAMVVSSRCTWELSAGSLRKKYRCLVPTPRDWDLIGLGAAQCWDF